MVNEEPIKTVKILKFAAENILKKNKRKQAVEIASTKYYVWKCYVLKAIIVVSKKI